MSLTVLLSWQHAGLQTSQILKAFLATFSVPFSDLLNVCLTFFELEVANYLERQPTVWPVTGETVGWYLR